MFILLQTVAGEAFSRCPTSKMMLVVEERQMISPDIRQSFLLSSKTELIFSIHTLSTGPSNTSHFLSYSLYLLQLSRQSINTYIFLQLLRSKQTFWCELGEIGDPFYNRAIRFSPILGMKMGEHLIAPL